MRARRLAAMAILLGIAGTARAQEATEESEARTPEPRREIRVLRDPYELWPRSTAPGAPPCFSVGPADLRPYRSDGFYAGLRGPTPASSYYRQGGGGHYSAFWQSGYAAGPRGAARASMVPAYRDTIGENGDLYLFAPVSRRRGPFAGSYYRWISPSRPTAACTSRPTSRRKRSAQPVTGPIVSSRSTRSSRCMG